MWNLKLPWKTAPNISSIDGANYSVEGDGESMFNKAEKLEERIIVLKYKFSKDDRMWYATDTLKFRNRIRDGVNEWQGYGATVQ